MKRIVMLLFLSIVVFGQVWQSMPSGALPVSRLIVLNDSLTYTKPYTNKNIYTFNPKIGTITIRDLGFYPSYNGTQYWDYALYSHLKNPCYGSWYTYEEIDGDTLFYVDGYRYGYTSSEFRTYATLASEKTVANLDWEARPYTLTPYVLSKYEVLVAGWKSTHEGALVKIKRPDTLTTYSTGYRVDLIIPRHIFKIKGDFYFLGNRYVSHSEESADWHLWKSESNYENFQQLDTIYVKHIFNFQQIGDVVYFIAESENRLNPARGIYSFDGERLKIEIKADTNHYFTSFHKTDFELLLAVVNSVDTTAQVWQYAGKKRRAVFDINYTATQVLRYNDFVFYHQHQLPFWMPIGTSKTFNAVPEYTADIPIVKDTRFLTLKKRE